MGCTVFRLITRSFMIAIEWLNCRSRVEFSKISIIFTTQWLILKPIFSSYECPRWPLFVEICHIYIHSFLHTCSFLNRFIMITYICVGACILDAILSNVGNVSHYINFGAIICFSDYIRALSARKSSYPSVEYFSRNYEIL